MANVVNKKNAPDIRTLVSSMKPGIAAALPQVVTPERFTRIVLTAISNNPKLAECTQASFLGAMMNAAQLGLEINTPLGMAYMIPRNNKGKMECVFQIGYKGLLELCYRTGEYRTIAAEAVHENDLFEIEYGLHRDLIHKPAKQNRGAVIGYYAVYILKDGSGDFAYMSREEVEMHRDRYSPAKSSMSPWNTNFDAMAKKTVIIKALKYAKKASEIERAVANDGTIKRMQIPAEPGMVSAIDIDAAPVEYYEPEEAVPEQVTGIQSAPDTLFEGGETIL
jgi:recombination protein RecT